MRTARRVTALLLASAILFGLPCVLVFGLSWPQLDLTWQSALIHLRSLTMPRGLLTALLMAALWGVWALYVAALAVELVARLRGSGPWIRPLGPLQVVAATAIGASLATPASAATAATAAVDTTHVEQQVEPGHSEDDQHARSGAAAEETSPGASATAVSNPGENAERSRTVAGFGLGEVTLTDPMRQDLSDVADLVRDFGPADTPIRVVGHTDSSGPEDINRELSEQRAESAAEYLRGELGEQAPTIETEGAASAEPRDGDERSQRRVEIVYEVSTGSGTESETASPGADGHEDDPPPEGGQAGADAADTTDSQAATGASRAGGNDDESDATAGSAASEDGTPVVMLEVPHVAATGALVLAGVVGGYAAGRKGPGLSRIQLSLPGIPGRSTASTGRTTPTSRVVPSAQARPTPAAEIDPRVTVELDHVPGLGLTGPGARPAARRLVVNALGDPAQCPARVLMTEAHAVRLLGPETSTVVRAHACDPIRIVDSMDEALERMQRELHDRETAPDDTTEARPLILVTEGDARHETALAELLLHGQHNGVSAVVLDRWPLGGSCEVAEDGLITETSSPLNKLYHASWPGSDQSEVATAVRAYRDSRTAAPEVEDAPTHAVDEPTESVLRGEETEPESFAEPAVEAAASPEPAALAAPTTAGDRTDRVLDLLGFTTALVQRGPGGEGAKETNGPRTADSDGSAAPAPHGEAALVSEDAAVGNTESGAGPAHETGTATGDDAATEPQKQPEPDRAEEAAEDDTRPGEETQTPRERESPGQPVAQGTSSAVVEEPKARTSVPRTGVGPVPAVGPASPLPRRNRAETGPSHAGARQAATSAPAERASASKTVTDGVPGSLGRSEPASPNPSGSSATGPGAEGDPPDGDDSTHGSASDEDRAPSGWRARQATARAERVRRMRLAKVQADASSAEPDTAAPAENDAQDVPQSTSDHLASSEDESVDRAAERPEPVADDATETRDDPQRMPRKPRKAGRGRNWRPRETT